MGLLAGVVGVMDVSRFATASIAAHTQDNLAAIAAVVIGGTSLFGGKGRMGGTVIGALIRRSCATASSSWTCSPSGRTSPWAPC